MTLLRVWRRRYRLWVRSSILVAAGATVGLIAAAWLPNAWAGGLGAVVTAVVTTAVLGAQAEWERRANEVRRRPSAIAISSARGGFPLVRELSDAIAVGVHPATAVDVSGELDRVPPYIPRDIEPELMAALGNDGFVLLVGESTAGKTRAAFEAMRQRLGTYRFVSPSSREALPNLLEYLGEIGNYVVWLDDLERFLGSGGLTQSLLRRLLAPPVRTVVLATMRSHEYDRYRDRVEEELAGTSREIWRDGRAVLRQARVIHVDRRWTERERTRAQAYRGDIRVAQALAAADRFGVAESLAAGPELAEAWRDAWTPGRHPRGAALVAAAVGARRFGYHHPLPVSVLEKMHAPYLMQRGGAQLRPESLEEAVRWASAPTFPNGANSLLIGSAEQGYVAFEYLIDLPVIDDIPEPSLSALLEYKTGPDAYVIAEYSLRAGYRDQAIAGYRRAATTGNSIGNAMLIEMGIPILSASESLERAQSHLRRIRSEFGRSHPETIQAEQSVLICTFHNGQYADALVLAQQLIERGGLILGPQHRSVLAAKFSAASCTFKLGNLDDGLVQLDAAVEEAARVLGPLDTAVATRRIDIVHFLIDAGQTQAAWSRLAEIQADYSAFPPDHTVSAEIQIAVNHLADSRP